MRRLPHQSMPRLRRQQSDGLLREIVDACLPLARRRIATEATTMSADELRGYLRARTLFVVRDQTWRLSAAHHFENWLAEQLFERALERTVNLLLREFTEPPPLVLPIYEAPRRAAA